jgi:hypothetical protein
MDASLPELELQQEIQRFVTQFTDRVTQATEILERSPRHAVRDEALRKNLLYVSSAMEIASGPFAEVNLLDLVVFVRLSRAALDRHWIPRLYGQDGASLAEVFARSEADLGPLVERVLTPGQRNELSAIIDDWLAANPNQARVEGIRLSDFSQAAGAAAAARASQARGLLSSVKTATRAANQVLSLSERAMFLFHRLPSVWRLQARLGAREMVGDALVQLTEGPHAPIPRMTHKVQKVARVGLVSMALLSGAGALTLWLSSGSRHRR